MHKIKVTKPLDCEYVDVFIIGSGPAGLSAAIYAARAGAKTIIAERENIGGQMTQVSDIKNYPGFSEISGSELAARMREQAIESGALIDEFCSIKSVDLRRKVIACNSSYNSRFYRAKSIIIAAGTKQIPLKVPGAEKLLGKGVHYCALCDGHLYKEKTAAVIGGGSSALTEAIYLSKIVKTVYVIRRKDYFKAEKALLSQAENTDNIKILYNTDIVSLSGEKSLETINVSNTKTGENYPLSVSGLFVYVGSTPQTELFTDYIRSDGIETDGGGFIVTDENMETSLKGVFCAGDIRAKDIRQISTAVGDGSIAGIYAAKFSGK
ncbi:MAG: FAD-dependent oxidoreductase [Ruminococcus sp.]|jgi:thioredoxin reductase (NADPH)|nr:FAD-dependent oxidoreductase [Ruminococcus sp.]